MSFASHPSVVGYCTNVHAGIELDQVLENLRRYSVPVREQLGEEASVGVGLWFSGNAAKQAIEAGQMGRIRDSLQEMRLTPYTLNGFPQGDFHQSVVKHRVYLPTWWQTERRDYTLQLIELLDGILSPSDVGSISTLPISWGVPTPSAEQLSQSASHLLDVARALHRLHEAKGRKIVLAIEPEPGCYLTDTKSLRSFFDDYLSPQRLGSADADMVRKYLTLCHDVCHAAVMNEVQSTEIDQCHRDGITIGKVQVSSAIEVDWNALNADERENAFRELQDFAEDRYLHQTNVINVGGSNKLWQDLPELLRTIQTPATITGKWRIHFHVPIFLERFGHLQSTQPEILKCLGLLGSCKQSTCEFTGHFEIETYAWGVLPESLRAKSLNEGIAREIQWFTQQLKTSD